MERKRGTKKKKKESVSVKFVFGCIVQVLCVFVCVCFVSQTCAVSFVASLLQNYVHFQEVIWPNFLFLFYTLPVPPTAIPTGFSRSHQREEQCADTHPGRAGVKR